MIGPGFVIENPQTGSRIVVLECDANGWLLESTCPPKAGPDITEHLHLGWTETFEIISGSAFYKLNGQQLTATAGQSFTVQPGQKHVHPWNAGDTPMVYRQRDTFGKPSPTATNDVLGTFATIAALARQGKVAEDGTPKHPLQLAATIRTLIAHDGYDAKLPIPVQKVIGATLGRLAERLGYRAVDAQVVAAAPTRLN